MRSGMRSLGIGGGAGGVADVDVQNSIIDHIWAGAGIGSAPTPTKAIAIGVNQGGISTANVYLWNGTVWNDTTATVANLFGV